MSGDPILTCPRCGVRRSVRHPLRPKLCRDCHHAAKPTVANWAEYAACRNDAYNPEWWWPTSGRTEDNQQALGICARCDVVDLCLEFALRHRETYGIWGNTTPEQRALILQHRRRVAQCR